MAYTIRHMPEFLEELDAQWTVLLARRGAAHANAWHDAALNKADELIDMPEAHALCLDPRVQGFGLREAYFGAGETETHRLIFRVRGAAVEILTVRGFAQPDLTPGDL
ncbi:type II toxin-antitoxin system RelE/ParE family toxin [Alienimonas californiensis]|uniref:Plasmid stabilization system protein n=1 Tax=Alienimonas californiensis TaxID=2527989 RepID=A0A517P748_9PLAN|nr:hypothetical protein [Alienimonas californiensis]QDT15194.1 hypothetical protein CA12_12750 [Alienimonas californiensis]